MPTLQFSDSKTSKSFARKLERGELHKIRRGIYIDTEDEDEIARTLDNQWHQIACHLFDNPIAVARTAAERRPAAGRIYLVTDSLKKERVVDVGHLKFRIEPGDNKTGTEPFVLHMKCSNPARYLMENLQTSRLDKKERKTLGKKWVEEDLVRTVETRGEGALNEIRDEAKRIAPKLGMEKESEKLVKMISAILMTHPGNGVLQTGIGIAHAKREPFDQRRIKLFETFANYLLPLTLSVNKYEYEKSAWRNLSFFESYFSNYIEGTEFTIDEAEDIVFKGEIVNSRHEDSHDIRSHMDITRDLSEMNKVPATATEFIDILRARHSVLMAERSDKRPGRFKERENKAGSTVFVAPKLVKGTLVQGFNFYQALPQGMKRAFFMHFLVSECHPFEDGNGRMSRIMMNAELVSTDQFKIMVPTVHRDSYLNGLRNASRDCQFRTSLKVLHQMQCYTTTLDWHDYGEVRTQIEAHAADKLPDEGVTVFNKVISKLGDDYPPG